MRPKTVAIAGTVLIAGGGAWAWLPTSASQPGTAAARPLHRQIDVERVPVAGRIFLSPAQLAEARASGTLDHPVKSLLSVDRQLQYGDYVWNDAAVPAGSTWIRVDLGSQLISIFQAGHEIGTAVIVYGGDNKQTPVGKLHVLAKAREHRSSLYDAEMPYTLRLTGDGVSIHGSNVRWGAATHGCIGVPIAFARRLFDATRVGDDVVVIPATRTS
jgi:lipoprotein-anchoring transpeptidase ErfK/SrfK